MLVSEPPPFNTVTCEVCVSQQGTYREMIFTCCRVVWWKVKIPTPRESCVPVNTPFAAGCFLLFPQGFACFSSRGDPGLGCTWLLSTGCFRCDIAHLPRLSLKMLCGFCLCLLKPRAQPLQRIGDERPRGGRGSASLTVLPFPLGPAPREGASQSTPAQLSAVA